MTVGVVDARNVWTGGPDQLTSGAILSAPLTATIPTDPLAGPYTGFTSCGYVSEDGLTLSLSKSFENIKDWSGSIVKRVLSEFDGTAKYAHLEVNEQSLKNTFGDANVTVTAATSTKGKQIKVGIGADDMPAKRFIFKMKDGVARVVVVLPSATVTETEDIVFVKNDAIKLGVTLGAAPDSTGKSIYIHTDDGIFSA